MKLNKMKLLSAVMLSMAGVLMADITPLPPSSPEAAEAPEPPPPPKKAFMGVITEKVASSTAAQLGLNPGIGLSVESVVNGSPADTSGIQKYDILMEMDGQWLTSVSHLTTLLSMKNPGDTVVLKILRKGEKMEISLMLGSKSIKDKSMKWEWKFDEKMEEFGQKMEEIAENEELMKHVRDHINPDEIEDAVRSAMDKARYHINQWVSDDGTHTSIVHSGNARSIITTDDGTLIMEGLEDGNTKVIAINNDDKVLYNGVVGKDGKELDGIEPWVKAQFEKISNQRIKVIIKSDGSDENEITETVEVTSEDAG